MAPMIDTTELVDLAERLPGGTSAAALAVFADHLAAVSRCAYDEGWRHGRLATQTDMVAASDLAQGNADPEERPVHGAAVSAETANPEPSDDQPGPIPSQEALQKAANTQQRGRAPKAKARQSDGRPQTWTEDLDRQLIEGRAKGVPFLQLADTMGRTVRALQNRHTRLKASGAVALVKPATEQKPAPAEPSSPAITAPVADQAAPPIAVASSPDRKPVPGNRVADLGDLAALTARQRRLVLHLDALSDDFAPIDDADIAEGLTSRRKSEAIADEMGCAPRDVVKRWKSMLTDDVVNRFGQVTIDGQADLLLAVRHLSAMAAANV